MRVALLIHDSLYDIMLLASLQRLVGCACSKQETRSNDGRLVLHVPCLLLSATTHKDPCAVFGAPFTAEQSSPSLPRWFQAPCRIAHSVLGLQYSVRGADSRRMYSSLSVALRCFWAAFQRRSLCISTTPLRFTHSKARQHLLSYNEELLSEPR